MRHVPAFVATTFLAAACVSGRARPAATPGADGAALTLDARAEQVRHAARAAAVRTTRDVITGAEFADARDASSALAALEYLRPGAVRRLAATGGPPAVMINGAYAGPLEVLRTLPARDVAAVRLVRAKEAAFTHPEAARGTGVIVVTLRQLR